MPCACRRRDRFTDLLLLPSTLCFPTWVRAMKPEKLRARGGSFICAARQRGIVLCSCLASDYAQLTTFSLLDGAGSRGDGRLVLALLATAYALMALNILSHYGLLAFGRVRLVSGLNVGSGIMLVLLMAIFVPRFGLVGASLGRIVYSLLLAVPYLLAFRNFFRSLPQLCPVGIS